MKNKWLITMFLLSVLAVLSISSVWAITNGDEADGSQYPWMVFVQSQLEAGGSGVCGGTLIAPDWVLTAAHCVDDRINGSIEGIFVYVGGDFTFGDRLPKEQAIQATKRVIHPNWSLYPIDNDLALLKLERPSSNQTISIPQRSDALYSEGQQGTIMGWGLMENNVEDISHVLREADVVIYPQGHCNLWHPYMPLANNMFCLRSYSAPYENAGSGDSGGPMIINQDGKPVQIGITSWGSPFGPFINYQPSVYVRAANYHDWIYGVVNSQ